MPGLLGTWIKRAAVIAALTCPSAALSDGVMTAPQAQAALAQDLVLIDIRSPEEWAETGLADGAWPVSMHHPSFARELSVLIDRFGADQIAMICATGGRTAYVASVLEANGITGIRDVSEGMFGNGSAPGWIARGLPTVTLENARADYQAALSN